MTDENLRARAHYAEQNMPELYAQTQQERRTFTPFFEERRQACGHVLRLQVTVSDSRDFKADKATEKTFCLLCAVKRFEATERAVKWLLNQHDHAPDCHEETGYGGSVCSCGLADLVKALEGGK